MKYNREIALDVKGPTEGFTLVECLEKVLWCAKAAKDPSISFQEQVDIGALYFKWLEAVKALSI